MAYYPLNSAWHSFLFESFQAGNALSSLRHASRALCFPHLAWPEQPACQTVPENEGLTVLGGQQRLETKTSGEPLFHSRSPDGPHGLSAPGHSDNQLRFWWARQPL